MLTLAMRHREQLRRGDDGRMLPNIPHIARNQRGLRETTPLNSTEN
jgi:hypothetical protein